MGTDSSSNMIPGMLPPQKHQKLHILISLLAVLVVAGCVFFYQITKPGPAIVQTPPKANPNTVELSSSQRMQIISQLQASANASPPISSAERNQIIKNLKNNYQAL